MPRPTNTPLLALFKCNDLSQIVCYNEKCEGKALYKHSANLERHLKLLHPSIYASYIQNKKILKFPRKLNFEKRLIDLVRLYPILWDKCNVNRFNEDLTNKAWREISFKLEVTVHMCKKKWDVLMEKFRTELSQMPTETDTVTSPNPGKESTRKLATSNDSINDWKSNWKYFPELQFMRNQIDLTKSPVDILPEHMGNIKMDYIKEESSDSFTQYNENLCDSSQFEYGEESLLLDDECDQSSTLIDEADQSKQKDDKEMLSPPENNKGSSSRMECVPQVNRGQSTKSTLTLNLDETNSEDNYCGNKLDSLKRKKMKFTSEFKKSGANDEDSDRMFLLSLLPFMKSIPNRRKLFVRHKLQGVLLEEEQLRNS